MVISLPYIFLFFYVLCFTRPRYQVSVYRTIDPLVEAVSRESYCRNISFLFDKRGEVVRRDPSFMSNI